MTKQDSNIDSEIEQLAEIEHQRWADWQAWCHKILRENCPSPELEAVLERWDKQIATPYKDLTEQEKQSDRDQVDRYLPLLSKEVDKAVIKARIDERKEVIREVNGCAWGHELYYSGRTSVDMAILVKAMAEARIKQLKARKDKHG